MSENAISPTPEVEGAAAPEASSSTAPANSAEEPKPTSTAEAAKPEAPKPPAATAAPRRELNPWRLRAEPTSLGRMLAAVGCVGLLVAVWALVTWGPVEERIVSPAIIGSPAELLGSFKSLWFDRALTRNLVASIWRVIQGFGLAVLVGVPLGIACGAWPKFGAFVAPISIFGRNVPISALVPLTLLWFGIEELQKVMFLFLACVMFVVFDSARAIASVDERYVNTALTLGARTHQVLFKVLVPLALPDIFGSLRLLFGLAFGYIILAEMVNMTSGVGALILISQRRGPMEHVYLTLVAITLVAYGIDRLLLFAQRWLFPYREEG